jgi:hypothetical protein
MLASALGDEAMELRVAVKKAKAVKESAPPTVPTRVPTAPPRKAGQVSVKELERRAAPLVDNVVLSLGSLTFACRELGVTQHVEKLTWMRTGLAVMCTGAAAVQAGYEDIPKVTTEQLHAEVVSTFASRWGTDSANAHGRSLQADTSVPLWAEVLTLVRSRAALSRQLMRDPRLTVSQRMEIASAPSPLTKRATRRMLGETAADNPLISALFERPARYTNAVQEATARLRRLLETSKSERESRSGGKKRRGLSTESNSPTFAPTLSTPACGWGKLCPTTVCGGNTVECPGFPGQCVADQSTCQYPAGASWGPIAEWGLIQGQTAAENINEWAWIGDVVQCWTDINNNQAINPIGAANPNDPNLKYCFPMPRPNTAVPYATWSLTPRAALDALCSAGVPTGGDGCNCTKYLDGLSQTTVSVLAGVAAAVAILIWDGFLAFWSLITYWIFEGTIIDIYWQSFWGTFIRYPNNMFVLWFHDQGQNATPEQRLMCAFLHLGDFFALVVIAYVLFLLYDIALWYLIAIIGQWIWIADFALTLLVEQVMVLVLETRYQFTGSEELRAQISLVKADAAEMRRRHASDARAQRRKRAKDMREKLLKRLTFTNVMMQRSLRKLADATAPPRITDTWNRPTEDHEAALLKASTAPHQSGRASV